MSSAIGRYLKKHTEALVKEVGIEQACLLTGKSKATLGRYYSDHDEHADRFMPIEAVALLEKRQAIRTSRGPWRNCPAPHCNLTSGARTRSGRAVSMPT